MQNTRSDWVNRLVRNKARTLGCDGYQRNVAASAALMHLESGASAHRAKERGVAVAGMLADG